MGRDKRPLVSVIIPVYNVSQYLDETIRSVISQKLDFLQNIELIIVDDGSTDNPRGVIEKYIERYPENIRLIKQKNKGVSAARNHGQKEARGEFIHFLDGDDLISRDFYSESVKFLREHKEVDFVASKIMFFDEIIDSHPLNHKFYSTRVVDLANEPDSPILHLVTSLFRAKSIQIYRFDESLSIAEDLKFIGEVLLRQKKYGVLSRPTYYYRKRSSSVSAIGGKLNNMDYYQVVPAKVYRHLLESWGDDSVLIEQTILYELSYRLGQASAKLLNSQEAESYRESILALADKISVEGIVNSRYLDVSQKAYLLRQRKNSTGLEPISKLSNPQVFIDFLTDENDGNYMIEGYIDGVIKDESAQYYLKVNDESTPLTWTERAGRERSFMGDIYDDGGSFEASFKYPVNSELSFVEKGQHGVRLLPFATGSFTKLGELKWTYRVDRGRLLKKTTNSIKSYQYSLGRHISLEMRMLAQIALNWRLGTLKERLMKLLTLNLRQLGPKGKLMELAKPWFFSLEAIYYIPRAHILRIGYHIAKPMKRRPIWIVSDRGMVAGDNGEALFRYMMKQKSLPADVYFAISRKSPDYQRIKQVGPVLDQRSLRYKLKFLLSDKIISSQYDVETTNPFIRQRSHYADLFNFEFIFLQHGIIRHNLSNELNRFKVNIGLFITSAKKEYDSILRYPYYYQEENLLLSGLPRFDLLKSEPTGKIILAPTYRKNIAAEMPTDKSGARRYNPHFKDTEYFKFYDRLINDNRLTSSMKLHGLIGEFFVHPAFISQVDDFHSNDTFKIMRPPFSYQKAFEEGNFLISDHSSVSFDFAYLKKPLAYAHFDVDSFFSNHSYTKSDFFDDTKDGFGEVYPDYDSLVLGVVDSIEKGLVMSEKYQKRVDDFFYKVDKSNCERVYDAIINRDLREKYD